MAGLLRAWQGRWHAGGSRIVLQPDQLERGRLGVAALVYDTERHLLYVACTRERDRLLKRASRPDQSFSQISIAESGHGDRSAQVAWTDNWNGRRNVTHDRQKRPDE